MLSDLLHAETLKLIEVNARHSEAVATGKDSSKLFDDLCCYQPAFVKALQEEIREARSAMTQTEAAEFLGISRPTVARYIRRGALRLNAVGRIPWNEIERFKQADG